MARTCCPHRPARPARRLRRRRCERRRPDDATAAARRRAAAIPAADLAGVKSYLTDHTAQLTGATEEFAALAEEYDALAKSVDYDYARLLAEHREDVTRILADAKKTWVEANPYYEQVEGVVAGTPSLAEYDIILDAGSSKEEDPESAVPFDLKLVGRPRPRAAGEPLQPHRGHALGNAPGSDRAGGGRPRRRRHGRVRRGAARRARPGVRGRGVRALRGRARHGGAGVEADRVGCVHLARRDGADDERVLRPVEGVALRPGRRRRRRMRSTSSPGSRTSTTSSPGSEIVYDGVEPDDRRGTTRPRADQTGKELEELERVHRRPAAGRRRTAARFTPEQADQLGSDAQARAEAVAGQVSQHAAQARHRDPAVAMRRVGASSWQRSPPPRWPHRLRARARLTGWAGRRRRPPRPRRGADGARAR